jgi:hypothetical protein
VLDNIYIEFISRLSCTWSTLLSFIAPVSAVVFAQGGYSAPASGIARITVLPKRKKGGRLARWGAFVFRNKSGSTAPAGMGGPFTAAAGFDISRFDIDVFDDPR